MSDPTSTPPNPLQKCLFFTANSLARDVTRMGEDAFAPLGMTPSYGFVMYIAIKVPGCSQKQVATYMNMAASTVSRFIDTLIRRGLLEKKHQGREILLFPTKEGLDMEEKIYQAWKRLYTDYSAILGEAEGIELTQTCLDASRKLQQKDNATQS